MSMTLPQFVIIGAQKSGSTYLLHCLSSHPEIYLPEAEIAFFETAQFAPERLAEFAAKFSPPSTAKMVGYKRANLLGQSWVAGRIKESLGPVKLIAVLRDPVSRCLSAYFHYMATGLIPIVPVEQGLTAILAGEWDQHPRAREILSFGRYAEHLRAYTQVFGRERLFVKLLDDFRQGQQRTMAEAFQFLEVDPEVSIPPMTSRPMAAPYSIPRIRYRRLLEDVAKSWRENGKYFEYRSGWFWRNYVKAVRLFDSQVLKRCFPTKPPELSLPLREQLARYYADDLADLADFLERPLSDWVAAK